MKTEIDSDIKAGICQVFSFLIWLHATEVLPPKVVKQGRFSPKAKIKGEIFHRRWKIPEEFSTTD